MRELRPVPEGPSGSEQVPTRPIPNGVMGMGLFVMSEVMLFAGFISAFTIVRADATLWPPPDQPRLPIETTAFNTVVLLLSGVALYLARRHRGHDAKKTRIFLTAAVVMGAYFVAAQGYEWFGLIREGLTLTSSVLGAFFYAIVGLHALHAIAALGLLVYTWSRLQRGWLSPNLLGTAEVFWYFVVLVWPVVYWRVYL